MYPAIPIAPTVLDLGGLRREVAMCGGFEIGIVELFLILEGLGFE